VSAATTLLERRLSRRGLFARVALVGSAVTTTGLDYVLHPGLAYASVCGEGSTCASGWTAMCCTINQGINRCPPGSFAGGWWKAEGASLCGGKARYYVDCQGECKHCGCHGSSFCGESCWNCKSHCANHGSCDERRVCHNVFRYGQCEQDRGCSGPVLCRAISCTPPWKWANCTSTAATDQATVSHSAPCLAKWTPIQQRYTRLGSQGSPLGASVHGEHKTSHGHVQHYVHGRMYWGPHTGAHYLTGHVMHHYVSLGEGTSPLGLPTGDVHSDGHGHGEHAHFQHGGIYKAHGHGAHALWDDIWHKWDGLHRYHGPLGDPTTDVRKTADGHGHLAHFTAGSIYQHHGHDPYYVCGNLEKKYRSTGNVTGPLGYLKADQAAVSDSHGIAGAEVVCHTGAVAQADGQHAYAVWGPIYTSWDNDGRAAGPLGFPLSDVYQDDMADGSGQRCDFEYGYATYDETTGQVTIVLT
jgi:uncharacterized protein with LGFP repeats